MRLRTLGGLELAGAGTARPRALLLLAYLALEGRQARRYVAELHWPVATDPRNRLSVTLSRLRQEAPGAVEADAEYVWTDVACDAVDLSEAVARRDVDRIGALYRGAFLRGVDLRLGTELEEWLYATREHLADGARHAFFDRARVAAEHGDFERAAQLAGRGAAVDGGTVPTPETFARVSDLLAAGTDDRGAAWRRFAAAEGVAVPAPDDVAAARARLTGGVAESPIRNDLPRPVTSFVGRERERMGIDALYDRLDARLVTLLGPGGVGKSRLALELAHGWTRMAGVDAVHFVPLVDMTRAEDVPVALLAAAGGSIPPGATATEALADALRDRQVRIVLDEAEHLADELLVLSDVLRACVGLRLLVTSRRRLDLEEEHVWELGGLSVPEEVPAGHDVAGSPAGTPAGSLEVDRIVERYDAARLFLHRARRARADLELSGRDLHHVLRICRLVEGTPLAIELAAVWLRSMSAATIADELERSLDVLASPSRNIRAGHRTIRTVYDRSWSLLPCPARRALVRLAVFRGGFTADLAREVAGCGSDALDVLEAASLVERTGAGRYRQHALVHQYGRERLAAAPGIAAEVEARHLAAMGGLARVATGHLEGADQAHWLELLDRDWPNLEAAFAYARRRDPLAGMRLAFDLQRFWFVRDHVAEVADAVRRLLATPAAEPPSRERAAALLVLARATPTTPEALAANREALHVALAVDDAGLVADAIHQSALAASDLGHPVAADRAYRDALERYRALGDGPGQASVLNHLGNAAYFAGDYEAATRWYTTSLELESRLGNVWGVASRLYNLGIIAKRTGRHATARHHYRRSLELSLGLGDRRACAYVMEGLACLASAEGDALRAARLWGAVDAERRHTGRHRYGHERDEFEHDVAGARAQVGPDVFASAWERGRHEGLDAHVAAELEARAAAAT